MEHLNNKNKHLNRANTAFQVLLGICPITIYGAYVEATPDNAVSGKYALSRFLYVYVNKQPNKELAPLDKEFIKLILSKQGKEVVIKDGYIPLPAKVVEKYLKQI